MNLSTICTGELVAMQQQCNMFGKLIPVAYNSTHFRSPNCF